MREIVLTNKQIALVDDDDFEQLNQFRWHPVNRRSTAYAARNYWDSHKKQSVTVQMHSDIIETPAGLKVDHKNGNGLDNRRDNLRLCTNSQNLCNRPATKHNTSGYKGVRLYRGKTILASIRKDGKFYHLGTFPTFEDAARAYDAKAKELHGDFAHLNFPEKTVD